MTPSEVYTYRASALKSILSIQEIEKIIKEVFQFNYHHIYNLYSKRLCSDVLRMNSYAGRYMKTLCNGVSVNETFRSFSFRK